MSIFNRAWSAPLRSSKERLMMFFENHTHCPRHISESFRNRKYAITREHAFLWLNPIGTRYVASVRKLEHIKPDLRSALPIISSKFIPSDEGVLELRFNHIVDAGNTVKLPFVVGEIDGKPTLYTGRCPLPGRDTSSPPTEFSKVNMTFEFYP